MIKTFFHHLHALKNAPCSKPSRETRKQPLPNNDRGCKKVNPEQFTSIPII